MSRRPPPLAQGKTFTVGVPLPLTGAEAKFGEMEKQAYEMAVEEINAKGGVKGVEARPRHPGLRRQAGDRHGDRREVHHDRTSTRSSSASTRASASYAVAGVAEKYKVPYLVVTGAADKITQQGWKYVYRLNPPSSLYNMGVFSFFEKVAKPKSHRDPLREHRLRDLAPRRR